MSLKAFDVACDTTGKAHLIKEAGYEAVGAYMRSDRCSRSMVDGLHSVGVKLFSIWEEGHPDHAGYFTEGQALADGHAAAEFALSVGQPKAGTDQIEANDFPNESQIFFCVDFDASAGDVTGPIENYFKVLHEIVKPAGYLPSVYGSGLMCALLTNAGLAHSGFLAQSKGWRNYDLFRENPRCAVVQGLQIQVCGFEVDPDEVLDPSILW